MSEGAARVSTVKVISRADLAYPPFPLAFEAREVAGVWTVRAGRAADDEIADLLVRAAGHTIVVADIATSAFHDEHHREMTPARIATHLGAVCDVHDFGALGGTMGLSEEALVMRAAELPGFLQHLSPYVFSLVGLAAVPSAERLDEIGLALGTADYDRPVLPTLPGCHLWFMGHDHTSVWIESVDRAIIPALLGRQLALQVVDALAEVGTPHALVGAQASNLELLRAAPVRTDLAARLRTTIADPPAALIETLLSRSLSWAGTFATATAEVVTVDLAVGDRVEQVATYDISEASWQLTDI